jgi:hypothetical protein
MPSGDSLLSASRSTSLWGDFWCFIRHLPLFSKPLSFEQARSIYEAADGDFQISGLPLAEFVAMRCVAEAGWDLTTAVIIAESTKPAKLELHNQLKLWSAATEGTS